jgi:hypothetical protein
VLCGKSVGSFLRAKKGGLPKRKLFGGRTAKMLRMPVKAEGIIKTKKETNARKRIKD